MADRPAERLAEELPEWLPEQLSEQSPHRRTALARTPLSLLIWAAVLPLGEGLAWLGFGLAFAERWWRRGVPTARCLRYAPWPLLGLLLALWWGSGAMAWITGSYGWLRPAELGRLVPWLLFPATAVVLQDMTRPQLQRLATLYLCSVTVAALFGLLQVAYNVRPLEGLLRDATSPVATQALAPHDYGCSAAGGFYFHRLKMAHLLVLASLPLVARQLMSGMRLQRRIIEGLALAVMVLALALTYARGAYLAFAAAVSVLALGAAPHARRLLAAAAVVGILFVLGMAPVRERLVSVGSGATHQVRGYVWSTAAAIIADHPFGVGLGNYPTVVGAYYDATDPSFDVHTYPHSVVLAALAEGGPIALWACVAFFVAFGQWCQRQQRDVADPAVAAVQAVLVAYGIVGLTHDVFFHPIITLQCAAYFAWTWTWLRTPTTALGDLAP